jgi:hypothetical protein
MIKMASFMIYCIVIVDQLSSTKEDEWNAKSTEQMIKRRKPPQRQGRDPTGPDSGPVWRSGRVASPVTLPDQRIEVATHSRDHA